MEKEKEVLRCNICGKEFDMWDEQEAFSLHKQLGYGTKFDGEYLNINICCECMENIICSCQISPLTDVEEIIL